MEHQMQSQQPTAQGSTGQFSTQTTGAGGMAQGGSQMVGGTGQGGGQQPELRYSDVETPEQRAATDAITRAMLTCGWCADQCIQEVDPMMIECIRLCKDVTELGETALALTATNSRFAQTALGTFLQAARACAQECSRHHHNHCQECAEVLGRTIDVVQQFQGGQPRQGGQFEQSAEPPGSGAGW